MWSMIAYGVIAATAGVLLILWAYWYFVIAPEFEAFRRKIEAARGIAGGVVMNPGG